MTEDASTIGGLKLKYQHIGSAENGVRFQGILQGPDGNILDRTTLIPGDDGTVRQIIEISTDDGQNWQATFDALYLPENHQ